MRRGDVLPKLAVGRAGELSSSPGGTERYHPPSCHPAWSSSTYHTAARVHPPRGSRSEAQVSRERHPSATLLCRCRVVHRRSPPSHTSPSPPSQPSPPPACQPIPPAVRVPAGQRSPRHTVRTRGGWRVTLGRCTHAPRRTPSVSPGLARACAGREMGEMPLRAGEGALGTRSGADERMRMRVACFTLGPGAARVPLCLRSPLT